jgi:predicted enzyme related to lactoylglutathione lyase
MLIVQQLFTKKFLAGKSDSMMMEALHLTTRAGEVSGTWIVSRKPHTEAGLLIHIMVDKIEDTIELIIKNGAKCPTSWYRFT